jgi:hypothetical protein
MWNRGQPGRRMAARLVPDQRWPAEHDSPVPRSGGPVLPSATPRDRRRGQGSAAVGSYLWVRRLKRLRPSSPRTVASCTASR